MQLLYTTNLNSPFNVSSPLIEVHSEELVNVVVHTTGDHLSTLVAVHGSRDDVAVLGGSIGFAGTSKAVAVAHDGYDAVNGVHIITDDHHTFSDAPPEEQVVSGFRVIASGEGEVDVSIVVAGSEEGTSYFTEFLFTPLTEVNDLCRDAEGATDRCCLLCCQRGEGGGVVGSGRVGLRSGYNPA